VVSDFSTVFGELHINESSYLVIVTRGHRHDQVVLGEALGTSASYIGLIGSRSKIGRIFRALEDRGADPARLRSVKAPIGLDIGSRTSEEIAVSIAAQLIAHRRRYITKGNDLDRLQAGRSSPAPEERKDNI